MTSAPAVRVEPSTTPGEFPPLCRQCHYPVSGLPDGASCPECGLSDVLASALRVPPGLTPRRLARAQRGAVLVLLGMVVAYPLYWISSIADAMFALQGGSWFYGTYGLQLIGAAGGLTAIIGFVLIAGAAGNRSWVGHLALILAALVLLAGITLNVPAFAVMYEFLISPVNWGSTFWMSWTMNVWRPAQVIDALAGAGLVIAICIIIARLADQLGDPVLYRRAGRARWLLPIILILTPITAEVLRVILMALLGYQRALMIVNLTGIIPGVAMLAIGLPLFWRFAVLLRPFRHPAPQTH